jgi:hypothetical protein
MTRILKPDKKYTFLFDTATRRPACVILQAIYGGDSEPCYVFPNWQIDLVGTFVRGTATGREIGEFAAKVVKSKT